MIHSFWRKILILRCYRRLGIGRAANTCLGVRASDHEIASGGTSGNIDFLASGRRLLKLARSSNSWGAGEKFNFLTGN